MRLAVICLAALLTGCGTIATLGSGYYSKEPILNSDGTLLVNPLTKQPLYKIVRESQHVAIAREGSAALIGRTDDGERDDLQINTVDCTMGFSPENVVALSATGQAAHFDAVRECVDNQGMAAIIAAATGSSERAIATALDRPMTEGAAIAREYRNTVASIEQGKAERTESRYGMLRTAVKFGAGVLAIDSVTDGFAAGTAAAAAAGGTKFNGDVSVSQSAGDSSDDPTGGASGEGEGGSAEVAGGSVNNTLVFGNDNQLGVADGDVQITNGPKADINENAADGTIFEEDDDGFNDGSTGTLTFPAIGL